MKTFLDQSKPVQATIAITLLIVILWVMGYAKAANQHRQGTLNLISGAMTVVTLNPVSAAGYRTYIKGLLADATELASQEMMKERAEREKIRQVKHHAAMVKTVTDQCINEIEIQTKSGSVEVVKPQVDGNLITFTRNMYKVKVLLNGNASLTTITN